jgi:hypothetical protein
MAVTCDPIDLVAELKRQIAGNWGDFGVFFKNKK